MQQYKCCVLQSNLVVVPVYQSMLSGDNSGLQDGLRGGPFPFPMVRVDFPRARRVGLRERFMLGWSGRVQVFLVSDAQICLDVLSLNV